jgi:hypothetical protein
MMSANDPTQTFTAIEPGSCPDALDFDGDRLEQGQRVSFVIEQGRDGKPKAARVVLLNLPDAA